LADSVRIHIPNSLRIILLTLIVVEEYVSILDGYIGEQELAAQLKRKRSTLERWRRLRLGPPFVRNGKTPLYHVESAQAWLRSGGFKPRRSTHRSKATTA
jgi:hypothetical protein